MSSTDSIVIIGGGQCGARAAHALRENGWDGAITLVGSEKPLPYERPPLSKAVLLGQRLADQCTIYDKSFYRNHGIDIRVDTAVTAIDSKHNRVVLSSQTTLGYRRLLIATGAEARGFDPLGRLDGVHVLREVADSHSIAEELRPGRRIVVIGAGFIGLEVAAAAVAKGCEVVVLEAAPRALTRAVPDVVAGCLVEKHRQMGVDFRFSARIARLTGDTRVNGVLFADGTAIPCDAVVVGIGVTPRVALAQAAGLTIDNGIAVDATLRTSDPAIYAAGDVCSFLHPLYEQRIRLECWKNAEDQARTAARNMLGFEETCSAVPWFWSDQYETSIQIAGLPALGTSTVIREAGSTSRVFFALDGSGVLVGASGVGKTSEIAKDVRMAQDLIARRARIDPAQLGDQRVKLRSLLLAEAQ